MFDQYKIALRDFYKAQKDSSNLSPGMENPTCLILKNEFYDAYSSRHSKADTDSIKKFFKPAAQYEDQLKNIDQFELDKLKPFINLMNKGTILRDEASVLALAWLLGFTPYAEWRVAKQSFEAIPLQQVVIKDDLSHSDTANGDKPKDDEQSGDDDKNKGDQKGTLTHKDKLSQKFIVLATTLVLTIALVLSWRYMIPAKTNQPTPDQKCMYWDGNQYIPTACDRNTANGTTVPLDIRTLNKLKKVRWPDLLTKKDIGKVWYARTDGQYEFFTDSGIYPVDPEKRLRPLSAYILIKHVSFYRFILQSLIWSLVLIVLLVILQMRVKKLLPKLTFRLNRSSIATEFTPQPQNLHGSA